MWTIALVRFDKVPSIFVRTEEMILLPQQKRFVNMASQNRNGCSDNITCYGDFKFWYILYGVIIHSLPHLKCIGLVFVRSSFPCYNIGVRIVAYFMLLV